MSVSVEHRPRPDSTEPLHPIRVDYSESDVGLVSRDACEHWHVRLVRLPVLAISRCQGNPSEAKITTL